MAQCDYNGDYMEKAKVRSIGSDPVRNPLVIAASENINMQISELNDQVSILLNRLSVVSRVSAPCAIKEKAAQIKESTPLSDSLEDYADRLFVMRLSVRDAIDRLEI